MLKGELPAYLCSPSFYWLCKNKQPGCNSGVAEVAQKCPTVCSHLIEGIERDMYNVYVSQEMIDEADKDGDGEVSESEFLRIMKKTNMY